MDKKTFERAEILVCQIGDIENFLKHALKSTHLAIFLESGTPKGEPVYLVLSGARAEIFELIEKKLLDNKKELESL